MKKKSIRFFALICTALVLFSNCASPAMAAENQLVPYAVEGGNIYFDPETGAIADCDTGVTKAVIPAEINGIAVTQIGYNAFDFCKELISVTIPSGVTTINGYAFSKCEKLTAITIPDSVSDVSATSFIGCVGLTRITVDGNSSFYSNDEYGVLFNKAKTELIYYPYNNPQTEYIIPDGVKDIGFAAFSDCDRLTNVTLPQSLLNVGNCAFYNCTGISDISIPDGVTRIGGQAFSGCTGLKSVIIPHKVIFIGTAAFYGCTELRSVTIPESVKQIDADAFTDSGLTDVYYTGSQEQWDQIQMAESNNKLLEATIHYASSQGEGNTGNEEHKGEAYLCDSETVNLFSKNPRTYDSEMAKLAATLSKKTYEGEASIEGFIKEKGFEKVYSNNYGGSLAFTVATKPYYRSNDGEQTDVLLIVAQGSTNLYEYYQDVVSTSYATYRGHNVYDVVKDFRNAIVDGLPKVTDSTRNYKVLVAGHSLGGAAANLVAAQITDRYIANIKIKDPRSDVFCYTFGAINSIKSDTPDQSGYENIHNVYNLKDTFSPKMYGGDHYLPLLQGNGLLTNGAGRGFGKFGHMDLFCWDYRTADEAEQNWWTQVGQAVNHSIDRYLEVVSGENPHIDISQCYSTCINHGTDGQSHKNYSYVGCPTDVDVYCEGELVGRVKNNIVDTSVSSIEIIVEDDGKYIIYPDDRQYDLQITAFDDGRMLFVTQDSQDGEPTLKVIAGVELTAGKKLSSQVGGSIEVSEVKLYVVDDDGEPVAEVQEDGSEVTVVPPDPTPLPPPYIPDIPVYDPGDIGGEDVNGGSEKEPGEGLDASEFPFTDVPADAYYADAVKWAVERKVTNGTTTTTFSPDKFCTRGEIVTFLWRAYGSPEPVSTENPFADVKPTDFFYKAVLWAAENDVTSGTGEDTFSPNDPCNRAEAVTFQYRAAKKPAVSGGNTFSDVSAGTWYSDAVSWAVEEKITNGTTTTTFSPDKICTRGDIVTFLWRDIDK